MEYFEGIEKQAGVQKKEVLPEKFLFFVPEQGKFVFCSNDAQLQKWCEGVKNKKVKGDAIKFVIAAAKKVVSGKNLENTFERKTPSASAKENGNLSSSKKKTQDVSPESFFTKDTSNFVGALNTYCQKAGVDFPKYTGNVIQAGGTSTIKLTMVDSSGYRIVTYASNTQEAKQKAAKEYARDVLKVKCLQQNVQQEKAKEKKANVPQVSLNELPWENPLIAMQEYCKKSGYGMPEYKVLRKGKGAEVTMKIGEKAYSCTVGYDILHPNSAKRNAVVQYAQNVLKINPAEIAELHERERERREEMEQKRIEEEKEQALMIQKRINKIRDQKRKEKDAQLQLDNAIVTKKMTEKGRQYQIQAADGTGYILDVSFDIVGQERRKYRETYIDYERGKELIDVRNVDMKTLTVGYQKISGDIKEKFSFQSSTPHLNTTDEALGRMLSSNMKVASKTSLDEDKREQLGLLRKLLEVSKDPLVAPRQNNIKVSANSKDNGR